MKTFLEDLVVPAEVKTAFFLIGYCHYCVLRAERSLKAALGTAFALYDLETEEKSNEKATFGRLLIKLRSRVDIDEDVEELLRVFLEHRNTFVHHLSDRTPFDTSDGLVEIANFCQILAIQARRVGALLNAALASRGFQRPVPDMDVDQIEELAPIADLLFRRKGGLDG